EIVSVHWNKPPSSPPYLRARPICEPALFTTLPNSPRIHLRASCLQRGTRPAGATSSGAQPLVLCLHAHQQAQLVTATRQTRAHRADRYFEDCGHFVVSHAFQPDEKDHFALLRLQLAKRGFEVTQLQGRDRIR